MTNIFITPKVCKMPNYVKNKVTIIGGDSMIVSDIFRKYSTKEHPLSGIDYEVFPDFNKVIQPPIFSIPPMGRAEVHWKATHWGATYATNFKVGLRGFEFDTPWNPVPNIISRISEYYPTLEFVYEYAKDCTGEKVGIYRFKKGNLLYKKIYPDKTKEAYELAFKILGNKHFFLWDGEKYIERE
jgi:hypothetical protein